MSAARSTGHRAMGEHPSAFHDLPASAFPFTMELLDAETREVRWSQRVTGPAAVRVPSRDEINNGKPLASRVTFADGEVVETEPGDA
jgi:hypothetical protein